MTKKDSGKQMKSESRAELGHGSQVVKILEDHSYELDETELQKILLKDEYKDLPVVVVSVAGTYRGGKSFLLNIFLRYLTSPPSAQQDGSWLAEDSKPLIGFSWRGGSVRNTSGILLWSVPVVIKLPSGDKVAVILMDTQGTFDNESTIRDCSTIFGLSTLLSSVQIYNLFGNLKEDDMQHLQLFTEYGKLARETGTTKPFQSLVFLIRDWPYPWEYPYGAEGGDALLQSKIKVTEKTPQEIKELREQLHSSFDKISGFLLPHPGFQVMNPKFKGAVKDLLPEFRSHLIELVASLFSPDKLMLKCMNSEKMKLGDLYTYFKTYMTLFNSDTVPNPTNIMQATVTAVLLNTTNEAREKYIKGMDTECGSTLPSVPEADLKELHRKYVTTSRELFLAKKKMGSPEEANKYLEKLVKELDARLPQIQMNNTAKLEATLKKAMDAYEKHVQNVSKGKALCLHPQDFQELHKEGFKTAINIFDSQRKIISNKKDVERLKLEQNLNERYKNLERDNNLNNKAAVTEICSQYSSFMENKCSLEPPLREVAFKHEHENAMKLAQDNFNNKRNRSHPYPEDVHKQQLIAEIKSVFAQLNIINTRKYNATAMAMMRQAFNKARQIYEKEMQSKFEQTQHSWPTKDVEFLHRQYLEQAKATFAAGITMGTKEESNVFLQELIKELEGRLPQYQQNNKSKLQTIIKKCEDAYQTVFLNISNNNTLCLHPRDLEKIHQKGIKDALKLFEDNRKKNTSKTDEEKTNMEQNLKKHYDKLQQTNDQNNKNMVRELHLHYSKYMLSKCSIEPPLREEVFKQEHETALKTAQDDFSSRRNKQSVYPDDVYKTSLITKVNAIFSVLNNINTNKYKATVLAEIAEATDKSRVFYDKNMMAECTSQTSMPDKDLEALHKKYINKAKETFNSYIKLATDQETSKHIKEITQELESRLLMFQQNNTSKYETTIKNAIDKYEEKINISNDKPICVHPTDLQKIHDEGITAAMDIYKANRKITSNITDEGKPRLDLWFKKRYVMLNATNDENNTTMLKEVHTEYWRKMKILCAHIPTYSAEDFKIEHERALKNALHDFDSKRVKSNSYSQDVYKEDLTKRISNTYNEFRNINDSKRLEKEKLKDEQKRLREENDQLINQQDTARQLQDSLNQLRESTRVYKFDTERLVNNLRIQLNSQRDKHRVQLEDLRQTYNRYLKNQHGQVTNLTNRVNDLIWKINNRY